MKPNVAQALTALTALAVVATPLAAETEALKAAFHDPAPDTRPGCYWYWINDNISKEGLTKDLEAMARVGIGRAYIGHIFTHSAARDTPVGGVKFGTEAWWEAVQWAVKEAGRVGVDIGFFNSPGWSQSGGPWVKPAQSMRYLDASETIVEGGRKIEQLLPIPEIKTFPVAGGSQQTPTGPKFTDKDFQDVAVIAFRQPETEAAEIDLAGVAVSSPTIGSITAQFRIGPEPQHIDFTLDGKTAVQSLRLVPHDHLYTFTCVVAASDDGETYGELVRHAEERGHQGPRNKNPILVPFPETTAKHIRVTLSANRPVAFSDVALSRRAVLGHYVRKQLGETSPSVTPPWNAYQWPPQAAPASTSVIRSAEVIDLTEKADANGRLVWDAPPGRWIVKRLGMVPIGTQNAPASAESRGLEVCKMSRDHIRALFDGMVGEFLRRTPEADRQALKFVIADSYETGPQNWTDGMVGLFEEQFGYSPLRFLPCLQGRVVDNPEITTRFLWDWRRLIAERIATEYVGGLREVAHEHGLTIWLENYGHWGFPSEFLLYGSMTDEVGGEFWENGNPLGNVECRAAASAANIYGRDTVFAEAYTSNRTFKQSPASMKAYTDWIFSTGINQFILHVNIHQPDERKPGIAQWFGTDFNRHSTWFEPGKAFIDYLRRCSVLLQSGRPIADVAYYIGEGAPVMTGRLEPALPDGHDYDFINSDVLIHRAKVVDGRIAVANGPSYAVLVLPPERVMRPEVAAAIRRLVRDGATVVGPRPEASPSLAGYPDCDAKVRAIAAELWGGSDGGAIRSHAFGQGRVYPNTPLAEVFATMSLQPAVRVEGADGLLCAAAGTGKIGIGKDGGIVFKHRASSDHEVFFLANTSARPVEFTASLRVKGRRPELWNAVTGEIRPVAAFRQDNGRTLVPLRFEPSECVYLVFGETIAPDAAGPAATNTPETHVAATLDGPWTVRFDGFGAPAGTTFDTLVDWSSHPDPNIKHYSGTAVYQTRFILTDDPAGHRTVLALGEAGIMARVVINGKDAGTAWTTPWEVNITDQVKAGENTLEIHVTNTWNNRLLGDMALPVGQRQTHLSESHFLKPGDPLLPSGLMGPVTIQTAK